MKSNHINIVINLMTLDGISKIFSIEALIRKFFRKSHCNGFRCLLLFIPFFCDLLEMSYRVFVFVQVILQISKILNDFMFYFPMNTATKDNKRMLKY